MSEPSRTAPIRVLLVEDHDMVAEAIGLALQRTGDVRVVATARSVAQAMDAAGRHRPDVVLLDRRLPDGDGIAAIAGLRELGAQVLVLTGEATSSIAARVVAVGGAGLVLKSSGLEQLVDAVRRVAEGEAVFDGSLLAGVLNRLTGRVPATGASLTERERQTLSLLADGASTDEIGRRLGVARNTVRNHVQRVLDKLGARSKLEAVSIARREGLVD
ncbi:DNA-binding NarL/FixJ family response regulator [Saccharothrix tamanrassetensis]|uniref:DNA-binding NarL/FixJ family response regulator n=1 Tax=Saccharothrix tamanrassetensis TaxID=1051531 RepID=A0A841CIQ9_9PSEU|nr:response regulator transcription factor [Saccharothrix tamanrassetensis]MBB5956863.1 DNA-binding NarL/FixJ family response regulator [Saccharothrix tamanrassetensis]